MTAKIYYPSRFVDQHVGGNTTYTRRIKAGVEACGFATGTMPRGRNSVITALAETGFGLRKHAEAVLHYTGDTGPLLPVRTPSVVTVHGVSTALSPTSRNTAQAAIWHNRVKLAIKHTDRLITVSESSAKDIIESFDLDPERITVIHHGIDADRFATRACLSDSVKRSVPERYVLYLGNIEPKKNVLELVRAFRQSGILREGIHLVIAGRLAWNYESTIREIRSTPGVVHLGFIGDADCIALMQNCELFVFPSLYEGFGFPVLEALAAGAVVACTRRGALAEVAGPAINIEGTDAEAIAHSIILGLHDSQLRRRVQAQGLAWARSFSWDRSIQRHISVYKEILT